MLGIDLGEFRCEKCSKLLFRGTLGLGVIEVKCPRCGKVNLLHTFDDMLAHQPNAYILIFKTDGAIVATSKTAMDILGYSENDFAKLNITDVNIDVTSPPGCTRSTANSDEPLTPLNAKIVGKDVRHKAKDGRILHASARYYPFGVHSGHLIMGVYYLATSE